MKVYSIHHLHFNNIVKKKETCLNVYEKKLPESFENVHVVKALVRLLDFVNIFAAAIFILRRLQ